MVHIDGHPKEINYIRKLKNNEEQKKMNRWGCKKAFHPKSRETCDGRISEPRIMIFMIPQAEEAEERFQFDCAGAAGRI